MVSKEIKNEIQKMLISILVMVTIMILLFAVFGYFDLSVVFGGLLGGLVAFLNFFFLALSVEKAVHKEQHPKSVATSSYALRMIFIAAAIVFAIKSPYFNYIAMVIPLVFPRFAIMFNNLIKKRAK